VVLCSAVGGGRSAGLGPAPRVVSATDPPVVWVRPPGVADLNGLDVEVSR
jgi:hypothetical protein